jgi:integrase/recombinase XerD
MATAWSRVKVVGPLEPYGRRFADWLFAQGYRDLSAAEQLRLMGHLSRWMIGEEMDTASVSPLRVEAFCRARRGEGYTARLAPSSLGKLLEFLRSEGVVAMPSPAGSPVGAEERLLARYEDYLVDERGLVDRVVAMYLSSAALFVADHPGLAAGAAVIETADVSRFCTRVLSARSPSVASNLAAGLRSFLRFLHVEGMVGGPLAQAVPRVANRKGAGLPRGLAPGTVSRLLASCDRRTRRGRRDFAILSLLARLGLRAGEVAGLSLDDIGWRAGEIGVHGKGGRHDQLPLPEDVGTAIVAYLQRGRPKTGGGRTVFLRAIAPVGAMTPTGITWVVYSACDRAGLPRVGAHRLRHTLASDVLRSGGTLVEAGQIRGCQGACVRGGPPSKTVGLRACW